MKLDGEISVAPLDKKEEVGVNLTSDPFPKDPFPKGVRDSVVG